MITRPDLFAVARRFQIYGEFVSGEPYGSGHINDTYCLRFEQAGTPVRYLLQRINHNVFKNPPALMENVQRVTSHINAKLCGQPGGSRRVLTLIPAHDGRPFVQDAQDNYWRTYLFIERAQTYDAVQSARQAFEAAKAFGSFQRMLSDLAAPKLHETIPGFHDTPKRFAALVAAIERDVVNRAGLAKKEIEFALHRRAMTSVLLDAGLPERVTHNDTKFNNVMLDDTTGEGICVIDLDTVMPGLALYDFGDMVRTTTCLAREDELDLSKVRLEMPMFEALVRGYLASAGSFLTPAEKQLLNFSGKLITFEIGIRFLTDFLAGDSYFKVRRNGHNLDRCRTQFKLVQSLEENEKAMQSIIEGVA
jgi:hypothetical protein